MDIKYEEYDKTRRSIYLKEYYQKYKLANAEKLKIRRKERRQNNLEETRKYHREYYKNNKDRKREYNRKYYYGMASGDYENILKKQYGSCQVCGKNNTNGGKKLSVDHCHKTGAIRGILCNKCNIGIGYFNDDILLIKNVLKYLKNYEKIINHKEW